MVIPNQNILITQENLRNIQDPFNPNMGSDRRPQVAEPVIDRFNKHLTNSEIAYINKIYHQDNDKKKKTIMDLKLGEIMDNTANFFNDFLYEYTNKIYDTQLNYGTKGNEEDYVENFKIYIIAFVRYIIESNNIIYFGIILIIISIILYFLSIINSSNE